MIFEDYKLTCEVDGATHTPNSPTYACNVTQTVSYVSHTGQTIPWLVDFSSVLDNRFCYFITEVSVKALVVPAGR